MNTLHTILFTVYPYVCLAFFLMGSLARFDRDVLARKPDAVLIEFCVNDGERDRTQDMERMIHKTWLADPGADIAIFYTLHQTHLAAYQEGRMPLAAAILSFNQLAA